MPNLHFFDSNFIVYVAIFAVACYNSVINTTYSAGGAMTNLKYKKVLLFWQDLPVLVLSHNGKYFLALDEGGCYKEVPESVAKRLLKNWEDHPPYDVFARHETSQTFVLDFVVCSTTVL